MVRSLSEYSAGMRWVGNNLALTCTLGLAIYAGTIHQSRADEVNLSTLHRHEAKLTEQQLVAQELVLKGDSAYGLGDYKEATESYAEACSLVRNAPKTRDFLNSVAERYAQSAVEYSKQLSRFGNYDEAREVLSGVLKIKGVPEPLIVQQALAKLDDPLLNNPALTPAITREVESVRQALLKAEGYFNLGQFDQAKDSYKEVLRIDKYNKAARRGMERVNVEISKYADTARDHARSESLNQVADGWEMKINSSDESFLTLDEQVLSLDRIQEVRDNKLNQIVIPVVDFQDVGIREAYERVRTWSREYDISTLDTADKGINFVLNFGAPESELNQSIDKKRFSLNLRNVPLTEVLGYISKATGTQWKSGTHAILVSADGAQDQSIQRRTFSVPPSFMQDAASASTASEDIFASGSTSQSAIRSRVSAKDFFIQRGVTFPEGASVKYIPATTSLIVANTSANIDLIEEYVNTYAKGDDVQVVMKVTIMETEQTNLEELGFDWLVSTSNSGSLSLGGGSQGNGFQIPSLSIPGNGSPMTSGLRSGSSMFNTNQLDGSLSGALSSQSRGPGIATLSTNDFQVIMRGLSQNGGLSRLDTATLIANSGQKATLSNGREFVYPSEYEPPELPNTVNAGANGFYPVTPATPTAFETRNVGMSLEAEATVSADKNYIDIKLIPELVSFDGFVNYGSPITTSVPDPLTGLPVEVVLTKNEILQPVFESVKLTSAGLTLRDGANFVIAGLTKSTIQTVEDKIPIVGDVPVFGRLFRSEGQHKRNKVLLIFVNVELQDPTGRPWRDK